MNGNLQGYFRRDYRVASLMVVPLLRRFGSSFLIFFSLISPLYSHHSLHSCHYYDSFDYQDLGHIELELACKENPYLPRELIEILLIYIKITYFKDSADSDGFLRKNYFEDMLRFNIQVYRIRSLLKREKNEYLQQL